MLKKNIIALLLLTTSFTAFASNSSDVNKSTLIEPEHCRSYPQPGVNWSGCNKANHLLAGLNFQHANLARINLNDANLTGSRFRYANLQGADMIKANFSLADFSYADFLGGNVSMGNFYMTNFSGARWVDGNICAQGSIGRCHY